MINKNSKYSFVFIFFVCILSISAISATENNTSKEVINTDNKEYSLETVNHHYDDVSHSNENVELKEKENNNEQSKSETDKTTTENENPLSFTDLNTTINDNTNSTIYLSHNYTYNSATDSAFKEGITISRNLTIYGNGVTIDGSDIGKAFHVHQGVKFYNINFINCRGNEGGALYGGNAYKCNFIGNDGENGGAINSGNAYNCTFIENNAEYGGALYGGNAYNCTFRKNNAYNTGGAIGHCNAYNCTFIENTANYLGGAMLEGHAYNCTFIGNKAERKGGAIYEGNAYNCYFTLNNANKEGGAIWGNAYNCKFKGNTAPWGPAMYMGRACLCTFDGDWCYETIMVTPVFNVLNYTSTYKSGKRLQFSLTADGVSLDGVNTTINIYKNGAIIQTVYGLTGEGWIVDLEPGEYTAELSLTDYPEENSTNATITVNKENTYIVITPIDNVKVGQEITINYTTNSNGTVTIKVNGKKVSGGKFTPTTNGTYNVSVEITENDYYTNATNETTFKVKVTSTIIANPVTTTYNVDKYLKITLKDQYGKAIKNAVLTVNLGGAKKYKTDKNGQIKINVATLTPKTYNAKITYAGSNNYNASTSSVKVTVKKATPKIAAKSAIYKLKLKTKKYPVIIKNNKNKALKNTKVTLKVNGKTFNVKTNSKGLGVFKITNLKKKGIYIAVITVPTNKYYNKISKKMKIAVKS